MIPEIPKVRIIAFDLMSALGWAMRDKDGVSMLCGTETFKKGTELESPGMRWMRLRNWLRKMFMDRRPEIVFFERVVGFPPQNKGRDLKIYTAFEAHVTAFCAAAEIECKGIGVGEIKKFIAGNGAAKKEAVIAAVKAQGFHPKDSNQADAIALLLYGEAVARGEMDDEPNKSGHVGRSTKPKRKSA